MVSSNNYPCCSSGTSLLCKELTRTLLATTLLLSLLIHHAIAFCPKQGAPRSNSPYHDGASVVASRIKSQQGQKYERRLLLRLRRQPAMALQSTASRDSSGGKHPTAAQTAAPKQTWITCSSTKELTHAIQRLVKPGDTVAELGSQLREVSTTICESIQSTSADSDMRISNDRAVLVDTVRKFPKESGYKGAKVDSRTSAMRRAGDEEGFFVDCARFHEIHRLDDWRAAFFPSSVSPATTLSPRATYDVFIVDVNSIVGNDLEWTTLSIIREFLALNDNKCRIVLVKSLSLNQWASRLIHGQRWCRQNGAPFVATENGHQERSSGCHVVATVGVPEYRETIPYTVRPGDAVLEIGCHLGTSTDLLQSAATASPSKHDSRGQGYSIGVDIGSNIIKGAQKRHPHIFFAAGDAWRTAALLRTQKDCLRQAEEESGGKPLNQRVGFDVVYVDVGGLSGQDGVIESLSLISAIANALEPRSIVIKSLCMRRLSSLLLPYWKHQKLLE